MQGSAAAKEALQWALGVHVVGGANDMKVQVTTYTVGLAGRADNARLPYSVAATAGGKSCNPLATAEPRTHFAGFTDGPSCRPGRASPAGRSPQTAAASAATGGTGAPAGRRLRQAALPPRAGPMPSATGHQILAPSCALEAPAPPETQRLTQQQAERPLLLLLLLPLARLRMDAVRQQLPYPQRRVERQRRRWPTGPTR